MIYARTGGFHRPSILGNFFKDHVQVTLKAMSGRQDLKGKLLSSLSRDKPRSAREIVSATGIDEKKVWDGLSYWWRKGILLRSEKPFFESSKRFRGRLGFKKNTRAYYLYLLRTGNKESLSLKGENFIAYELAKRDPRGARIDSKAQAVLGYLRENPDKAFFSTDVAKALADKGVRQRDVMSTVKRYEDSVYFRGYKTDQNQTPFKEGYLLTWIGGDTPRKQAIDEAILRTDAVLERRSSSNPIVERVHRIRDIVMESSKLRDLVGIQFLQSDLGCTENEVDKAVDRTMQLYPDIKELKLFGAYRYFYHVSMSQEDLTASVAMKENYIRIVKGRDNRIGHNWEAAAEWFIDTFTTGAKFRTQVHREGEMDPRRITVHLMKPVGDRRSNAELDRVWEVTPGVFAQPIIYVLECKWGLVKRKYIDDFFEVLRWSKEFGVDSTEGRQVKQGVLGVFVASSFDPKETVTINDNPISLASYAARMNIQLLKATDFNEKMRDKGIDERVTVQTICRMSKDEEQVRKTLEVIWSDASKAHKLIEQLSSENSSLFEFEKKLQSKDLKED